ncbi:hypothetical protein ACFOEQ_17375 [Chryseobacterium arachidis]|uniref:hypothetical protein n=1 Tax=Chryseobacterium arachidis TaxID=1416778 RepID=UPI00361DDF2D
MGVCGCGIISFDLWSNFVFNNGDVNEEAQHTFAVNNNEPKTESQIAYETLQSDLTSVENNNQTVSNQRNKEAFLTKIDRAEKAENDASKTVKPVSTQKEVQMNEYLDNFSNSEIAELASNSTQDVYLDLYN